MQDSQLSRTGITPATEPFLVEEIEYPQVSTFLLILFCGYVITWYLQLGSRVPLLGAIRFEFLYGALLSASALFFTPKAEWEGKLPFYVGAYLLAILLGIPGSVDFETSWMTFVNRVLKFSFLALFIVCFVRSPKGLRYFLAAFLLACCKMGQEGLIGRLTGSLMWENQGVMRLHGATELYAHPNSFSGMALGVLPFCYCLWQVSGRKVRAFLLVLTGLSLNIIIFTGSRTGYLGLLVFLLFVSSGYLNLRPRVTKSLLFGIGIAIAAIFLVPSQYMERFASIYTGQDKEGHSTEKRIEILKDAVQIFLDSPMGIGVSAFPKARFERFGRIQDTHNLYLEIATNLGVQGFVVFGLLIRQLLVNLAQIRRRAKEQLDELSRLPSVQRREDDLQRQVQDIKLIFCVASATTAYLAIRLTLGLFGMDLYEIYWWFCIGITIALCNILKVSDAKSRHLAEELQLEGKTVREYETPNPTWELP